MEKFQNSQSNFFFKTTLTFNYANMRGSSLSCGNTSINRSTSISNRWHGRSSHRCRAFAFSPFDWPKLLMITHVNMIRLLQSCWLQDSEILDSKANRCLTIKSTRYQNIPLVYFILWVSTVDMTEDYKVRRNIKLHLILSK